LAQNLLFFALGDCKTAFSPRLNISMDALKLFFTVQFQSNSQEIFMNKPEVDELIQYLQLYELSIANLYDTFATALPESRKAWKVFANEERLHAKWINALDLLVKNEKLSVEKTKFTVQGTNVAIDYIERQIDRTEKNNIDLKQALNIAINIEKSLLENAFLKIFKLSDPKAKKIQARLKEATKDHLERLMEWHTNMQKS
jgi:hypothetical protein